MTTGTPFTATTHHVALSVADLDAAQRWYEQALALREEQRFALPDPPVRTVLLRSASGLGLELIERARSRRAGAFADALDASLSQGYGHWALEVDDLDRAFAGLLAAGARRVSAPAPAVEPGARFAYVKDPEGNLIELIQPPLT
jgi:catechol 2,3-dioxygenase-like lactoylglutathione lyase family enzyme